MQESINNSRVITVVYSSLINDIFLIGLEKQLCEAKHACLVGGKVVSTFDFLDKTNIMVHFTLKCKGEGEMNVLPYKRPQIRQGYRLVTIVQYLE